MILAARKNQTASQILMSALLAAVSLFVNGFGIYLTIQANIGAGPWDVFTLGLSKTLGILYGNASVTISIIILLIDILMKEPIGLSMFIDAVVVGKSVDFFNMLGIVPACDTLLVSIPMMIVGLFIIGYTQMTYMISALGCGPRDTLLVGLKRRLASIPIGVVSIGMLSAVTFIGWLLGGPVGIGTLICAFLSGPIMQLAFVSAHFDATVVQHQNLQVSLQHILHTMKK